MVKTWKTEWIENPLNPTHDEACGGDILFSALDSEGNPTIARCNRCGMVWRKAYGWVNESDRWR